MGATGRSKAHLSAEELSAWRGFLRVHASMIKALDTELEAAHGLPLTSYEVLIYLGEQPEGKLRMRDLADKVLLSRSGLSRLADRLERAGLIEREPCPDDARGAYAVLTAAGRDMLKKARPTHLEGVRRRFLDHFGEDERSELSEFWERLLPGASGA
jgi:DNA-binding MarR family transcriptional regulator